MTVASRFLFATDSERNHTDHVPLIIRVSSYTRRWLFIARRFPRYLEGVVSSERYTLTRN